MRRRIRQIFVLAAPTFITVLLLSVLLCFANRWDSLVVITLIPIWAWALVGMGLSFIFWVMLKSRVCMVLFFLWMVVGVVMADETRSLGREFRVAVFGGKEVPLEDARIMRLVTVNCRQQRPEAAQEVRDLKPDIVFLQEAPGKTKLEKLVRELFEGQGSYVVKNGNAILARGRFEQTEAVDVARPTFRTQLHTLDDVVLDLGNVHLERSIPRFDLWKKAAWKEFTFNRVDNRRILRHLVRYRSLASATPTSPQPPLVVAGDFSTPPGDDVFRMLQNSGLVDAVVSSGGGGANTFPVNFPVLRLDQVWHSDGVRVLKIDLKKSPHTDHKILICDFIVQKKAG